MSEYPDMSLDGNASPALRAAEAFLRGDAGGMDPTVSGRDAFIAWAEARCSGDNAWWAMLSACAITKIPHPSWSVAAPEGDE